MENPKVSVITPTYKRSGMLPRAIKSVLNQSYQNIEIIVVDDNNPDTEWRIATEERMQEFKDDPRVKYVKHEKNMNGSVARNTGIAASTGDIITYLDDDDWYYTEKIEKQVKYLLDHPEHHAVYCGWRRYGDELPNAEGDVAASILSGQDVIITNSIMMWKKDTVECGGWDNTLRRHQEAALLLNYCRIGGAFGRLPEILVEFDISDRGNTINNKTNEKIIDYLLEKYDDLVELQEKKKKGSKAYIYCGRYKALVYSNILNHKYVEACRVYCKILRLYPFYFNVFLFKDILKRITKKK